MKSWVVSLCALSLLVAVAGSDARSADPEPQDLLKILQDNNIDVGLFKDLPHKKIVVRVLPADTDIFNNNSRTYPPSDSDGVCEIYVIHPSTTRVEMIHQDSTIPLKYVASFDGPDYTFLRVLLHEARHCDQYNQEGGLAREILSDVFAAQALLTLPGGQQELRILKYKRAVRSMLGEGVSHAMALSLDALEKNQTLPAPSAVEAAHLAMYQLLYSEGILDPDIHGYTYQEEGDLLRQVYTFIKKGLASDLFAGDPLLKRSAELYVEGLEFLAPKLLATYP